jgi:hypothetical protein
MMPFSDCQEYKIGGDIMPLSRENPKAENLLKTNGLMRHFSFAKAENILKRKPVTRFPANKHIARQNVRPG